MRTRTTTIVTSLIAAFALAAVGSLAVAAEQANADYLTSTSAKPHDGHLNITRFPPRNPRFKPCIGRYVRIPAGTYTNGAYMVSMAHRTDDDLATKHMNVHVTASYHWVACRWWNRDHYDVRSTVSGHGLYSRITNVIEPYDPLGVHSAVHWGPGRYEWAGRIARRCDGCTNPAG